MNFKTEEKINIRQLCRSCLGKNVIDLNIYYTVDHEYKLKLCEIYRECTSIETDENDGLPHNICYDCLEKLRVTYRFLKQSNESENRLRMYLKGNDLIANRKLSTSFDIGPLLSIDKYECDEPDPIDSIIGQEKSSIPNLNRQIHNLPESDETSTRSGNMSSSSDETRSNRIMILFKCNKCDKSFPNENEYQQHKCYENEIQNRKTFLCSACGKYFKTLRNLESHFITHSGLRKYKCNDCDKTFNREDILRAHRRVHTGEKPYECNICGKKFAQSNTLKTHMFLHTGKTVKCRLCSKLFSRQSMLIVHNREHTGEKPYMCDQCPKRFFQQCHLSAHKLTHLDTKQFKCEICGKEYTQKSTLTLHMHNHTGKRFKCFKCLAGFNKKDRYRSHLIVHHGIEWSGSKEELVEMEFQSAKLNQAE